MTRNMFDDVVDPSIKVGGTRAYTVPLSIAVHTVVLIVLIIVPLVATDTLPTPTTMMSFITPAPPASPPPPPAPPPRNARDAQPVTVVNPDAAPIEAPHTIAPEREVVHEAAAVGSVEGSNGTIPGGLLERAVPPPPPPPAPVVAPQEPIRAGGKIKEPTKIKDTPPVYPAVAQAARVEGVVIIEATITASGRVLDAKVLRSIPLLDAEIGRAHV